MTVQSQPNTPWWRDPPIEPRRAAVPAVGQREPFSAALSFWALMGFTVVLLLAPQVWIPALAPLRIALLSAVLALLAHGFARLSQGLPLIEFSPPITLALCLLAWALVTMPFSYWPGGSVAYVVENFAKTVIVFVLLIQVIDSLKKLMRIAWALVLMSVPLAATTVANYLSGVQIAGGARVAGYTAGLTSNPNDMALMLNLILPLCIALLLATQRTGTKVLLGAIAGLLVVAIVATFSRGGFLALSLIALIYAWRLRRRPQRVWLPVLLALAVLSLPLVPASYYERISTIVNIDADQTDSAQTRLADMKVALRLGLTHPVIGAGIGMNALAMNAARGETWIQVHNVYLQCLVELGFPGLLLFLLLYGKCLGATSAVLRQGCDHGGPRELVYLSEGLRVSLIAFALAAMFYPVAYHFYFYYIAGLAFAAGKIFRDRERRIVV